MSSAFALGRNVLGQSAIIARTAISAIIGGVSSMLAGGKFLSGAVSAAFVHLFNAEASFRDKMIKMLGLEKVQDVADKAAMISSEIAKKYKLTGVHNGQWDAVRHCVGSCMVAREVGYLERSYSRRCS
jgi:hypothetical protein